MADVFLSLSFVDLDFVRAVQERLPRGVARYFEQSFERGEDLIEAMEKGLDASEVFVLFATRSSLGSYAVQFEIDEARRRSIFGKIKNHTIEVLRRLRAEVPDRKLLVVWDGARYHRAKAVRSVACELGITLMPLPGYSPDLMPVEALWRWLHEDVTYHHCHATGEDLTRRAAAFEARLNQNPCAIADRLWVKDYLDPEEEKLPFST
jgi:transposase